MSDLFYRNLKQDYKATLRILPPAVRKAAKSVQKIKKLEVKKEQASGTWWDKPYRACYVDWWIGQSRVRIPIC